MYLDQVDEASHNHGPESTQAISARHEVDTALATLLQGLRTHDALATTNLLVVSDHGFATVPAGQAIATRSRAFKNPRQGQGPLPASAKQGASVFPFVTRRARGAAVAALTIRQIARHA